MMLEQNQFRNRPADFVYMLLLGAIMLLVRSLCHLRRHARVRTAALTRTVVRHPCRRQCAVPFVDLVFLGPALSFMMVYVWAKYNPDAQVWAPTRDRGPASGCAQACPALDGALCSGPGPNVLFFVRP